MMWRHGDSPSGQGGTGIRGSNANRRAAGVVTGDEVEVEVELDAELPVVAEPADFARALWCAICSSSRTAVSSKQHSRTRRVSAARSGKWFAAVIAESYGRRVSCYMVMVRRARLRAVAQGVGMAPAR